MPMSEPIELRMQYRQPGFSRILRNSGEVVATVPTFTIRLNCRFAFLFSCLCPIVRLAAADAWNERPERRFDMKRQPCWAILCDGDNNALLWFPKSIFGLISAWQWRRICTRLYKAERADYQAKHAQRANRTMEVAHAVS